MAKIKTVKGRQVFDSRGNPTVEAEIFLDDGSSASAISPSGASTGAFEAHELRDKDQNKFLGKSVINAVQNINSKISNKLKNLDFSHQEKIDKIFNDNNIHFEKCLVVSDRNVPNKFKKTLYEKLKSKKILKVDIFAS